MRGTALCLCLSIALSSVAAQADEGAKKDTEEVLPNPSKKWGWGFLGAAVPLLVVGIGVGAAATARAGEQNGSAANPPLYTKDLAAHGREGETLAITAYCFLGLGAALAIVDAIIWYEVLRKPRKVKKSASMSVSPAGFMVRF